MKFPRIPAIRFPTAVAVLLVPMCAYDAFTGYNELVAGSPVVAALHVTAALMCVWALRIPADELVTRFALWWVKRKVEQAHGIVLQVNKSAIKQVNKEDEK